MSGAGRPILRVSGLRHAYGRAEVLHGIDLEVHPGEIVSLIGANGAGKSTTLMCISRIHRATAGRIEFDGAPIDGLSPEQVVRRGLVQVPEGRRIFPRLTVRENLEMGAFTRTDRAGIAEDIDRMCGMFPILRERAGQLGGTLSGGEQQMLAIARILRTGARLLLLDEPSEGLAPVIVQQIGRTIRELKKRGFTVLLVEQNFRFAQTVADRHYVMEHGRVVDMVANEDLNASLDRLHQYLGV
jgi:branched-chain amino acid transport system ATP-binding protein